MIETLRLLFALCQRIDPHYQASLKFDGSLGEKTSWVFTVTFPSTGSSFACHAANMELLEVEVNVLMGKLEASGESLTCLEEAAPEVV